MSTSRGMLGRALRKCAGWLAVNWVEPKPEVAATAFPAVITKEMFLGRAALAPVTEPAVAQPATTETAPVLSAAPAEPDDATLVAAMPVVEEIAAEPATSTAPTDFRLSARLSAIAKVNAPASRVSRRGQMTAPSGRAVPRLTLPVVKVTKDTRLPTAFAARGLAKKARPSAEIIEISTARSRVRPGAARRAA